MAAALTCALLATTFSPNTNVQISTANSGALVFDVGYPGGYNDGVEQYMISGLTDNTGDVCIEFTNFNLPTGTLTFGTADGDTPGTDTFTPVQTLAGTSLPKPFTFSADDTVTYNYLFFETVAAGAPGEGFQFQCTDGPCPCTTGSPLSSAFDQRGNVIATNGVAGTINVNPDRCLTFSNVDLQGGRLVYNGITYTGTDVPGPFSFDAAGSLEYFPDPQGTNPGSFTVTCNPNECTPQQLSPCTVANNVPDSIAQVDQIIESQAYTTTGYEAGDSGSVTVNGPACLTFDGTDGYNTDEGVLSFDGSVLSDNVLPGPLSVASGDTSVLNWLAGAAGTPGFRLFCNFGTCDSQTTTTSAPTTTSTTTSASTTSTTSAPSTTSTTTTTQTTVVPFPVSSCTKKSCRQLVKAKKQRLFAAAGCGDSTSCKNAVKATMPFNGNKKKACKPKRRQDVCQNIYWYT